jgi:LysM repeat protein
MISQTRLILHFLVFLFVFTILSSDANALKYTPKADESLSHVALIHYGKTKKYVYLTAANNIANPNRIPKGKALWIPTTWKYRIKRGDSIAKIAAKYLKKSNRGNFLLWLNDIKNPRDLKVGSFITIPFLLKHQTQQGQSMIDIARRYYFGTKNTQQLRKFNSKRNNSLKPGETVVVPIFDPETNITKVKERLAKHKERAEKMAKTVRVHTIAPSIPQNEAAEKAFTEKQTYTFQEGYDLYRSGDFELAQANLTRKLDSGKLSSQDEAEAREILASCLVALGQTKEAEHEFVRLLMIDPERTLDPITTSPKVLKVFEKAKNIQ